MKHIERQCASYFTHYLERIVNVMYNTGCSAAYQPIVQITIKTSNERPN